MQRYKTRLKLQRYKTRLKMQRWMFISIWAQTLI